MKASWLPELIADLLRRVIALEAGGGGGGGGANPVIGGLTSAAAPAGTPSIGGLDSTST